MNYKLSDHQVLNRENTLQLRNTSQLLMPFKIDQHTPPGTKYNIYPFCSLGNGKINYGYHSLAAWIAGQKAVVIDGYAGVLWDKLKNGLSKCFEQQGLRVNWICAENYFKPEPVIEALLRPFEGTPDAVWGTKCTLALHDLFDMHKLETVLPDDSYDINIIIGTGAALAGWHSSLIYVDLPKNELQFRMRAGVITNLGATQPTKPFAMYKRFYFVDWVLLNRHKKALFKQMSVIADGQWTGDADINWMFKTALDEGLNKISQSVIRVRPWFEPGAWGGQWIKEHIPGVNTDVVNYAWSFELIVPENGLVFESGGYLLEISFDCLMYAHSEQVLGKHAETFGDEFPIRFDFLDTFQGGNLSIQCHPRLKYIQENFGETITQDESYYILDCRPDAKVYLGFQDNICPDTFRAALTESQQNNIPVPVQNFVQVHHAAKGDLFLIPSGTVHSAGEGNLVLEISATPYIFTFKMYDWLRLDLDGNPRPINIDHAFNNLNFERKGKLVEDELISKPQVIEERKNFRLVHLPTHPEHFYDVHRIEFTGEAAMESNGCCQVLMLVEGESVMLETANGHKQVFTFAETFVIPAAAKSYKLTNQGKGEAKIIKAFLK